MRLPPLRLRGLGSSLSSSAAALGFRARVGSRIEQRLIELQQPASCSEEEQVEYQWLEKEKAEIEKVSARLCRQT
jgi:cell division protein FtsB